MKRSISLLAISIFLFTALLQAKNKGFEEPTEEQKWLQRAEEQTNLRTLGAKPFHMLVKFHAYPGMELVPDNKRQIITGDGTYEETWLDLHRWRREVTFGAYHAVETDSGLARKMQASSDYEPVRVLMLMEALLFPVPKNVAWPNPSEIPLNWKMKKNSILSADKIHTIDFVKIERMEECGYYYSYLFLPSGLLLQRNDEGLAFGRQDQMRYGDKVVARQITIQAGGRNLLTADISIESTGSLSAELFDQSENPAEPGMTLRPIHIGEAQAPETDRNISGFGLLPGYLTLGQVVTRNGERRETEVFDTDDQSKAKVLLDMFRSIRIYRPARIDESPCELFYNSSYGLRGCGQ
ncbi:MAG: hypothetical protein WCF54_08460 [Terracidiphilus sp.]